MWAKGCHFFFANFYFPINEVDSNFPINEQIGFRSSRSLISNKLRLFFIMRLLEHLIWTWSGMALMLTMFMNCLSTLWQKLDSFESLNNIKFLSNEAECVDTIVSTYLSLVKCPCILYVCILYVFCMYF
jgi:hypothetical protein